MSPAAVGALLGLVAGAGLWLALLGVPGLRRPTLDDRLAPYLGGQLPPPPGGSRVLMSLTSLAGWLAPASAHAEVWLSRLGSDGASVRRRLRRCASPLSPEQFRAQQMLCGLAGTALGGLLVAALLAGPGVGPAPAALLLGVCGFAGLTARDQALTLQVRRRSDRLVEQFPAVAELLALSVGAGEGALGALDRVARTGHGELVDELRHVLADARAGLPLTHALQRLGDRLEAPSISTFVDGMVIALDRGTPLAEVLRAQAQDVRVASRRRLMESGGRREVLMMIPVVFLILPVTVLFAIYPGLAVLDLDL